MKTPGFDLPAESDDPFGRWQKQGGTMCQLNLHQPHNVLCLPSSWRPHYQSQCSRPGRTVILKNSPAAPMRDVRGRMWWPPIEGDGPTDVCFLLTDVLRCELTGPLGSVYWPGQRAYITGGLHCCLTRRRRTQKTTNLYPSGTSAPSFFLLHFNLSLTHAEGICLTSLCSKQVAI